MNRRAFIAALVSLPVIGRLTAGIVPKQISGANEGRGGELKIANLVFVDSTAGPVKVILHDGYLNLPLRVRNGLSLVHTDRDLHIGVGGQLIVRKISADLNPVHIVIDGQAVAKLNGNNLQC